MAEQDIKRLYMDDETKRDFDEVWFKSFHRKEKEETKILPRGIIVPSLHGFHSGGLLQFECVVLDENGITIEDSGMFGSPVSGKYPLAEDIPFIDKDVVFAGRLFLHFGHFLLQSLTRLYCYLKNRDKDLHIVWIIGKGENPPKFILDFFGLLNIPKERIILIEQTMRFRNVFCPPISSRTRFKTSAILSSENYCDFTDDFLLPFKEAAKNVAPAKYKKVYWTRKYWTNIVQCLGEQDIERVFVKNGFKSIAPEQLSLKEQIAIYKGADEIAGINGSSFHTALFRDKPNLKLIMLHRNEEYDFQYIVNEAIKSDWYVIKAYANPFPVSESNGPFIIGMTSHLKEFLRDHGLKDFNVKLNVGKYLKDFCLIYANIYSEPYHQATLEATKKMTLDAGQVIKALRVSNYSLALRIFYYIAYHITVGPLKIKYKNRHRALKSFAKARA